ncbi:MAG: DUF883 domain-containing protein [Herminiimonas sp.]|nr:DUF883 domain-containing protein [Herminiimonas sp.]
MEESIPTTTTARAFARDLQQMLEETEALLKNAGRQVRREYRNVRDQLVSTVSSSFDEARSSLGSVEESVLTRTRDAAAGTNEFVQRHPWQAVAAGACVGFLVGIVMARR